MARFFLIVCVIFLSGCLQTPPQDTASASGEVVVEYDKFKQERIIRTPLYLSKQGFTDTFPVSLAYEATEKNGAIKLIRLYVVTTRTEWGFYRSATGEDGYEFQFFEVDGEVDSAGGIVTVEEHFSLSVPIAQLRRMVSSDYEIKVYGKRDSGVFTVPASVTRAFLNKLNSL
ncbi:hypothetical protein [Roseovarius salis]|uniref:hypothetical protein n=1 Tax=Roseovarius salis TaxID=3376063 RepID=UPI0037CAF818